jgi:acetyltransferase-like isoleucine patch superfamily enzyme
MKLLLIRIIRRLLYPNRYNSTVYVNYLKKKGCDIGEGTYFFDPINTNIDVSRIGLLKIGKYCKITSGVHILTHDYSRSVIRLKYKQIINGAKFTSIGENVFIGLRSIILPGVTIGDNVVIAAGSVVVKDVPANSVIGGNPARVISTLDNFYEKREGSYIQEAQMFARNIRKIKNRNPNIDEMGDFFPLYFGGDLKDLNELGYFPRCNGDDKLDFIDCIKCNKPIYDNFELFLKSL